MYSNMYGYNPQFTKDRIDGEIARLQQMKEQISQPPSINQTFQLAPQGGMKFANTIDEVNKEIVYADTPYFSHDLSLVWIKNTKGNIKAYEMKEIVKKDEKDLIIENLQMQINEMKEEIRNAKPINADVIEPSEDEQPTVISSSRTSKKK